jgi:hypothetical protein
MKKTTQTNFIKIFFAAICFFNIFSISSYAQLVVDAGTDTQICAGSSTVIGGSPTAINGAGGYTYTWTPTTGLSSTTTANPTASPTSTITYTVSVLDSVSGVVTDVITITVDPVPVVTVNSPSICAGSVATLTGNGASFSYTWTSGATTISVNQATASPLVSTSYTVTGSNLSGCSATAVATVTVLPSTSITGHVGFSSGNVAVSSVILYHQSATSVSFDTVQLVTTDSFGLFTFSSVIPGNYLVEVFPAATYSTLVPTYYGNGFLWDSAMVLVHTCASNDTINIVSVETLTLTGPGAIAGTITEGTGYTRTPGDPIPGVDVKLGRNPGGQLIASTETDGTGNYSFNNLPLNSAGETYTIFVDIPGLERDSTYVVTLTSGSSNLTNLDYVADSSSVAPGVGIGIHEAYTNNNKISLYPNPAKDIVTIEYVIENSSQISLSLYNLLGVKIGGLTNKKQSAGTYKHSLNIKNYNLSAGVYFVIFEANGQKTINQLIISE